MDYSHILKISPFSLSKNDKESLLTQYLISLTDHHYNNCELYKNMLNTIGYKNNTSTYYDLPFLPVRLFKELDLRSITDDKLFKTITSSGTSGQAVSKIYLDKETASNQQKTLIKIVSNFISSSRSPMIIVDSPDVIKNRAMFSARGAGILGFSIFGADKIYALNSDMTININAIKEYLKKYSGKNILIFGFTFIVWQHFYKELLKLDEKIDLSNAVLIHGGGWKKLINYAVSKDDFKRELKNICDLSSIHDYYGMVEQTGCIYMECEQGHLHASIFSDIIIRNHIDFSCCKIGEKGIVQVVSMLPNSYPGHSILTEDEGEILGEDDCKCGRLGKYFKIYGRIKEAEIRGCSDTYGSQFK